MCLFLPKLQLYDNIIGKNNLSYSKTLYNISNCYKQMSLNKTEKNEKRRKT